MPWKQQQTTIPKGLKLQQWSGDLFPLLGGWRASSDPRSRPKVYEGEGGAIRENIKNIKKKLFQATPLSIANLEYHIV